MRALSLCQPYASMVAGQVPGWRKSIETRTWTTAFRGPLLICAAKHVWQPPAMYRGPDPRALPRGVALCVVDVVDCFRMLDEHWADACCDPYEDAYGWGLSDVRAVTPFPVLGRQRMFHVEPPATFWPEVGLDPSDHVVRGSLVHA